jgi:outer membrane protein assembly factor BamB
MEPPISYSQSDPYSGTKVYGKKSGCAKFSCFGVIGALFLLVVIGIAGYYFALPALMPNSLSGDLLNMVIVPGKDGNEKLWILTDGSFNFIQTTKSPGHTSTGRECYFCKTWTYIVDAKTQKVLSKTKTPYEDIITLIDMFYYEGKVWTVTREYGENEPRIEAFNSESGEKIMDTKQFISKFPDLSSGLTEAHYDKNDFSIKVKTHDGRERIYNIEDGKLYKDYSELNTVKGKDSSIISMPFLVPEDNSSAPRKKLIIATGPKTNVMGNKSSFEHFSRRDDYMEEQYKIKISELSEKIYLEGIIYYQDDDCAIIIYLDKLGKKSDRTMACIDLKTGKEKWTVQQEDMFKKMKIDEEDDAFSSLFFTKDYIDVKRSGNLVVLQYKGRGIMGYDFTTGKKLFEMDI